MSKGKGYSVEEVGQKGEVVIGDEFLEELGVQPGWRAFQFMGEDHVKIYFAPPKSYDKTGRQSLQVCHRREQIQRRGLAQSKREGMDGIC